MLVGSGVVIVVGVAGCGVSVCVEDATGVPAGSGVEVDAGLAVMVGLGRGVEDGKLVAVDVGSGAIALQAVTATTEQRVITTFNGWCIKYSFCY